MIHCKRYSAIILAIAVLIAVGPLAKAAGTDPAAELARDIAQVTGPGPVAFSLQNISSTPDELVPAIRRALEAQLRAAGVRLAVGTPAAFEVTVTLSENVEGYLWIAAIRQGRDTRVAMRPVPRAQVVTSSRASTTVVLRKTLLWSQPQPVLDAAVFQAENSVARLAVLDPEKVSLLRSDAGQWELEQSLPVTHAHPFPRDVRGRLVPARDHLFDAYLPGEVCSSTATAPLAMICRESDDPWPLQPGIPQAAFFGGARNFFPGALAPGIGRQASTAPFYSAAGVARPEYTLWLFAGTDGRVRASDGANETVLSAARDWGSEIAAVNTPCGTMLLAAGNGDDSAPDAIRAYEVADREPAASSQPLEFPGPVTALWSLTGGGGATAVALNLKTQTYEVYTLAISCP